MRPAAKIEQEKEEKLVKLFFQKDSLSHSYLPPAKLELILIRIFAGKTLQRKAKVLFKVPGTHTVFPVSYTHLTLPTKRIV